MTNRITFRLLALGLLGLLLASCMPFGGGQRGEEIRGYVSFDPSQPVADSVTPAVVAITVDSCEPVRVIFLSDRGQLLGTMLDSVICPGTHLFDLKAVWTVVDTAGRPETTWVRLDTLPLGMYFYKTYTSHSTDIENMPLLRRK